MRSNAWMSLVAFGAALALSGCGGQVRQALGMTKHSPDEFVVVAHAPLTLPPDYNLRPPAPGAPRPQEGTAAEQAQTALYANNGGSAPATGGAPDASTESAQSSGEVALLQNAGASGIDPGIRSQIDTETAAQVERDPALISRLVLWRTAEPQGQTPIITIRK